jgi:hypothetical protein
MGHEALSPFSDPGSRCSRYPAVPFLPLRDGREPLAPVVRRPERTYCRRPARRSRASRLRIRAYRHVDGPAYGASPDRVILMGHSTGGWPAAVLGLTRTPFTPARESCSATAGSLRPDLVVVEDGVLDQVTQPEQGDGFQYVQDFLEGPRKTRPAAWAAADPFGLANCLGAFTVTLRAAPSAGWSG